MRMSKIPDTKVTLVEYDSLRDLAKTVRKAYSIGVPANPSDWAGGTSDYFLRSCERGDPSFVKAADKYVTQFGNVAIQDHARTLEMNMVQGALDYQTAMAGNPMCMYGTTIEETDRSPVELYIDPWVSGSVSAENVRRRGVGVLALVQSLSVYRPVRAFIVKGSRFTPRNSDTVQVLSIPTAPMDTARAAWMLASPSLNRQGFLIALNGVYDTSKPCSSPPMSSVHWQEEEMPRWFAKRNGVKDFLFMRRMTGEERQWNSDAATIAWINDQLDRFIS